MTTGENSRIVTSARRLRQRWLDEPSPPLAVDDEPHWTPAPDGADGEGHRAGPGESGGRPVGLTPGGRGTVLANRPLRKAHMATAPLPSPPHPAPDPLPDPPLPGPPTDPVPPGPEPAPPEPGEPTGPPPDVPLEDPPELAS